jgi:hypothetical protein
VSDKTILDERVSGSIWQLLHKEENCAIHLPLFFSDLFQINYVLTPWPYDSLSLGLQDDICSFFGIISFDISRFAFSSPKAFSSSVNHLILSLSTFLLPLGFLLII